MDRFREEKVRTEKDLAEVRRELAVTIEEQRDNPKPARAAELEKTRHELEVTVSVLEDSLRHVAERNSKIRATLDTRKPCPICGGKLTKIKNVARKNQQKNRDVWQPASRWVPMCGNVRYLDDSPICTRCWAAQEFGREVWTQASADANSFVVPLSPALAKVPLPVVQERDAKWTFWRRQEASGKRHEWVWLWLEKVPAEYVDSLKKYARQHGLEFSNETPLGTSRVISISTPREPEDLVIPNPD